MSLFSEGSSMQRWCLAAACAVAISCVAAPAAAAKQRPQDRLNAYTVVTTAEQLAAFEEKGLDVAESRVTTSGVKAQMILTRSQAGTSAPRARARGSRESRAA
jgi:hypothetical protein